MLVRLLPDQISDNWELIKHAIKESVPPTHNESPEKINNIFESLLLESMACWASIKKREEGTYLEGILITTVLEDKFSKTRNLLVYCIYSFTNQSTDLSWEQGLCQLIKYGRSLKCDKLVGYTRNENLIRYAERIGADLDTFISIPLFKNLTEVNCEVEGGDKGAN